MIQNAYYPCRICDLAAYLAIAGWAPNLCVIIKRSQYIIGICYAQVEMMDGHGAKNVKITLRHPSASDAITIGRFLNEKDIADSIPGIGSGGTPSAHAILNSAFERSAAFGERHFVIEADRMVVGMCVLYNIRGGKAEIGYWISAAYRRKGYATAAIRTLAGKAYLMGVRRISATVMRSNHASSALLHSMGFAASDVGGNATEYSADTASIKA